MELVNSVKGKVSAMVDGVHDYFGGWFWPIAIVGVLVLTHAGRKCYLVSMAGWHLLVSKDKSVRLPHYDPGKIDLRSVASHSQRTLVFIRHGRSTWNEVMNQGINWKLPLRAVYALSRECVLFITSDSCFIDAPLDTVGISQAAQIQAFLRKGYCAQTDSKCKTDTSVVSITDSELSPFLGTDSFDFSAMHSAARGGGHRVDDSKKRGHYVALLNGSHKSERSVIVSSPLRRCLETVSLGLYSRFEKSFRTKAKVGGNCEQILVLSCLQEMTRNVDGMSLCGANETPPVSFSLHGLEEQLTSYNQDWDQFFASHLDVTLKDGLKSAHRRGDDRMRAFVNWLFRENECDNVVVSGHSLWFRTFFKSYLARNSTHPATVEKIVNGGVVALTFHRYELESAKVRYAIDEDSIFDVIGGFEDTKRLARRKRL